MDESYTYLNDDQLHQLFDFCVPQQLDTVTVHLCIYDINTKCKVVSYTNSGEEKVISMPFLKYIVQQTDSNFIFPQFQLQCSDDNDTLLRNESLLRIMDILGLTQDVSNPSTNISKAFKGFVLCPSNKDVLAVYDFSILRTSFSQTNEIINLQKFKWCIVDDLVFEKHIYGLPIDPIIVSTFHRYHYLWKIKYHGREIDTPFALYNVKEDDNDIYTNEMSPTSTADTIFKYQSIVKIGETTDTYNHGDVIGEMHLFSATPVMQLTLAETLKLQRYAVFTTGCKYIVDEAFNTYMTEYTQKKGNVVWTTQEDTLKVSTDEDTDYDYVSVSSIYFIENKLFSKLMPLWGIRQPYRFEMI